MFSRSITQNAECTKKSRIRVSERGFIFVKKTLSVELELENLFGCYLAL